MTVGQVIGARSGVKMAKPETGGPDSRRWVHGTRGWANLVIDRAKDRSSRDRRPRLGRPANVAAENGTAQATSWCGSHGWVGRHARQPRTGRKIMKVVRSAGQIQGNQPARTVVLDIH
jgi:hypothetical protein